MYEVPSGCCLGEREDTDEALGKGRQGAVVVCLS